MIYELETNKNHYLYFLNLKFDIFQTFKGTMYHTSIPTVQNSFFFNLGTK